MPLDKVTQTFTKGYNGDASPYVLGLDQVSAIQNMLPERGLLISRPGLTTKNLTTTKMPFTGVLNNNTPIAGGFGGYLKCYTNPDYSLVRFTRLKLTSFTDTALALPAGYIFIGSDGSTSAHIDVTWFSTSALSGYDVISGWQDGATNNALILVPYGGGVPVGVSLPALTGLSGFNLALVTHLSRVVAATVLGRQLLWSKIGDPTVWTGHFTTGNVILPEVDDEITGLKVVRNVLVVTRRFGISWGVPTGNGQNPYDWKCISKGAAGCAWPRTLVKFNDELFFVGADNVYRYDMQTVTPIGEGICKELFTALAGGYIDLRGGITYGYKYGMQRPQYHIITATNSPADPRPTQVHFVYDIVEQSWSRHIYSTLATDVRAFEFTPLSLSVNYFWQTVNVPCIIRRDSLQLLYWDYTSATACESAQSFTTGRIQFDDPTTETKIVRMLVVAYCSANNTQCAATYNGFIGNTFTGAGTTFTLNAGWNRVWVNQITVGNFYTVKIDIPAGVSVQFRQLIFVHETSSQEVRV